MPLFQRFGHRDTGQITVLAAQTATADFALGESTTSGAVSGSAANTTASDNVYEVLTEAPGVATAPDPAHGATDIGLSPGRQR